MAASQSTPVLQARGLIKRYGQVTALDGADFDLLEMLETVEGSLGAESAADTVGREQILLVMAKRRSFLARQSLMTR